MADLRRPERLLVRGPRHLTKTVLLPVRFLFTAATGRMGTNEAAVDHYLADGARPGSALVGDPHLAGDHPARRTRKRPSSSGES